jgi:hypothetical protein
VEEFLKGRTVIHPKAVDADKWIGMIEKEKEDERKKRSTKREEKGESRIEKEQGR